ncbi:hypothetical protein BHE74_00004809 [Ensete ventricosum]|nr:hypothetical protein BHE74_00004809 [Ensete ventricosum]
MPLTLSDHGSCWDLLCGEDVSELADDSPGGAGEPAEFPDDSDESIAGFIEGEADSSPRFDYPDRFQSKSLDPAARQEAVTWILKVSSPAAGDVTPRSTTVSRLPSPKICGNLGFIGHRNHVSDDERSPAIICATDGIKDVAFVDPGIAASWCIGLTEVRKKTSWSVLQELQHGAVWLRKLHCIALHVVHFVGRDCRLLSINEASCRRQNEEGEHLSGLGANRVIILFFST